MRILFITEFFPTGTDLKFSGGVEARTFFVAKYLSNLNSVTVIAARTHGSPKSEKMFNFEVVRVGPKRNYSASVGHLYSRILFIKEAIKLAKGLDMDIVDGGNYICHFIAKQISKYKKIPVVAWYPDVWLGSWYKNVGIYGIFGEILERINLKRGFDSIIAISKQTAYKLHKSTDSKINIIYCGVEREEFNSNYKRSNSSTILCVSRLTKYKNVRNLIFAFAHLSMKIKNARLVIVGTGPEETSLKTQVKALGISLKVTFLSNLRRARMIEIYKSSYIFSLPSTVEGFGIATIEAAALGLPYVNSDIAVQKEITKNGMGGFLVNPNDSIAFSDKIYSLFQNRDLYEKKSKEAKKLSSFYDWKNIARETESIYRSLL